MGAVREARELERSWLVQRLGKPRAGRLAEIGEVFSFGGGLKNGGLSDDAMSLVREIWTFDYMGAAEFEFGEVPKALTKIAQAQLNAWTFAIPLSDVPANWRDKAKTKGEGEATIYALAPVGYESDLERRVHGWATDSHYDEFRLKEPTKLSAALRPVEDWDRDTCGWLELNNGFLFFTDKEMWQKACSLFGVASENATA